MTSKYAIFTLVPAGETYPHVHGESFSLLKIGHKDYATEEEARSELKLIMSGEHPTGNSFSGYERYIIQEVFTL